MQRVNPDIDLLLQKAVAYYDRGHFSAAKKICQNMLLVNHDLPDALHLLGLIKYQEKQHNTAIALIEKAISQTPDRAVFYYNLGNLYKEKGLIQQAIACYNRTIRLDSKIAQAYFKLGVIEAEIGSADTAAEYYQRVTELAPNIAEAWHNRGLINKSKPDLAAAVRDFQQAIKFDPAFAEAYYNLGKVWRKKKQMHHAVACLRKALEIKPEFFAAHITLGELQVELGEPDVALEHFIRALKLKPESAQMHHKIGTIYKSKGKNSQALRHFKRAIQLKPEFPEALFNLAYIYELCGDLNKAVDSYRKVLEIEPQSAETLYNIAGLMAHQGRLEDAISCVQQAIQIKPDHAESHSNLGNYFRSCGLIDKAIEQYRKAIAIDHSLPLVHLNLSMALLLSGHYAEGWQEYEWRMQVNGYKEDYRYLGKPLWNGKAFSGYRLLVHEDQGLGDTIQFVRYLPMIKKMGGSVIFESRRELTKLMRVVPGIDELVERPTEGPSNVEFDFYIPLLSVPGRMGTQLGAIPADVPYLFADPDRSKAWAGKMQGGGFKIGFGWAGNKAHVNDVNRSCNLEQFAWLAEIPQTVLFSLQKEHTPAEERVLNKMGATNLGPQFFDFSETAAVLENLDLVIVVDTAVAHLNAAMGKATWILLPFNPDWRWMCTRSDSPWYPTVRLFRQSRPGDWDGVMSTIGSALKKRVQQFCEAAE